MMLKLKLKYESSDISSEKDEINIHSLCNLQDKEE
jgi:hypothetical protein